MKPDYSNTYWSHRGKYQSLQAVLAEKIPAEGEVENHKQNPMLEKFRKASNCYYDLYNNGLCNRAAEFARVFGFSGKRFDQVTVDRLEQAMDKIILLAAVEQDLVSNVDPK